MDSTKKRKIISIVGVGLCVVMTLLVGFLISQHASIIQSMMDSQQRLADSFEKEAALTRNYAALYQQTSQMLSGMRQDLDSTKSLLRETEALLTETRNKNMELQQQLTSLQSQGLQSSQGRQGIEQEIALLHEKNTEFTSQLAQLRDQMRSFEGDIKTVEEGNAVIASFKNKLKLVRNKIHYLKQEAFFAKEAVRRERDRVLLLQGNNGYLVKNGEIFKKLQGKPSTKKDLEKGVDIEVIFVE